MLKLWCWLRASDYGTYATPQSKIKKAEDKNGNDNQCVSLENKAETADMIGYTVVLT